MMFLKLYAILTATMVLFSIDVNAVKDKYLSLVSKKQFFEVGINGYLLCIAHHFNASHVSYELSFGFLSSSGRRHQFITMLQYSKDCVGAGGRKRFRAFCKEGTDKPSSVKKIYQLEIRKTKTEDYLKTFYCCISNCSTAAQISNEIQLKPFEMTLEVLPPVGKFIAQRTTIELVCTLQPATNVYGVIVFYRRNLTAAIVEQVQNDGCVTRLSTDGTTVTCGTGTAAPHYRTKRYVLIISNMKASDYDKWHCQHAAFMASSDILNLQDKLCDRVCQKGRLMLENDTCSCVCDAYVTGTLCDKCTRECKFGNVNKETCLCECQKFSTGDFCEKCILTICPNGGTANNGSCTCNCAQGWTGESCEIDSSDPQRLSSDMDKGIISLGVIGGLLVVAIPIVWMIYSRNKTLAENDNDTMKTAMEPTAEQ